MESVENNELVVTVEEQIIFFTTAILIVVGIFLYMARNIILRKKTEYDKEEFLSQKDRDYEKYHSDWTDDYEDFKSKNSIDDEEFRKAMEKSSLLNYYEILGVPKDAAQSEIKSHYRQLAKELHPDKSKNYDSDKMVEINKAYEVLSDKDRRARYDKYLNVS
ncbi:MAG: DnaJ domain-containing protein [Thaumarchaeota archaeon]|nr:DnaJ domain-containing protein [Nitrososphaerota archaeon]